MAAFDADRNCYVGRVVFDGAPLAGKTTNLKRLLELVPASRRTEMFTPGSLKGRTMFFDWLEIDGPASPDGIGLKFQLITVPGQVERNHRRRPLVQLADAVVFVFDCAPEGTRQSLLAWKRLSAIVQKQEREVPVLVQANKQDLPDARTPEEVADMLGVDPVNIIAAASSSGTGIQKTITTALKLARAEVRTKAQEGVVEYVTADTADADGLFFAMLDRDEQAREEESSQ